MVESNENLPTKLFKGNLAPSIRLPDSGLTFIAIMENAEGALCKEKEI